MIHNRSLFIHDFSIQCTTTSFVRFILYYYLYIKMEHIPLREYLLNCCSKKKKKKTFEDFRQRVFLNLFLIKKATTNVGQPGNNVLFLLHEFLCMSFNIRVIFFFFFHKA